MRKLPWLVVCASSAWAAPKKPLCVPGDLSAMTMFGSGGKAIACWEATGDCMSLDDGKAVSRPTPPKPPAEIRDDKVCNGKTCKPLGKNLASAVRKGTAMGQTALNNGMHWGGDITATTDLALVAISEPSVDDSGPMIELWNVADDKQLTPKKPAVYGKDKKADLISVEAIGAHAFATWSDCGMPLCGKEIVVEPSGGNYSKAFDAGETYALDNGTYAVVTATSVLTLDSSGRHSGALELGIGNAGMDGSMPTGASIGGNELVVLAAMNPNNDPREFIHVKVSSAGKATLGSKGKVPPCSE